MEENKSFIIIFINSTKFCTVWCLKTLTSPIRVARESSKHGLESKQNLSRKSNSSFEQNSKSKTGLEPLLLYKVSCYRTVVSSVQFYWITNIAHEFLVG